MILFFKTPSDHIIATEIDHQPNEQEKQELCWLYDNATLVDGETLSGYFVGPMGCLTGMYIIMTGTYTVHDMRQLTIECLEWILTQTEVPATEPQTCGNYLLHALPMCKWESARYLDRLKNDFHCEYTKLQVTLNDGKVFADA